ncbi:MAG: tRNA lysidine(34) synthetase TilS, partial [Verrucomicrobia bacterium]|nr:tRNA lysidine(34) synthetase TilS [Verrucomicrobiota bacterium]
AKATDGYSKDEQYLVGVSGGLDSRILLQLLILLDFRRCTVCHLDHGLRGIHSVADRLFVQRLARRLGLPFVFETLENLPRKMSVETASRSARQEFFARIANNLQIDRIFLGHHADDQVETFLFNLFRGVGCLENSAMRMESTITVMQTKIRFLRPLLQVWKTDLEDLARCWHIRFREDFTNSSNEMTRNRIRHELIPAIEKALRRPVKRALLRTFDIVSVEGDYIKQNIPVIGAEMSVTLVRNLPLAVQRRTIHSWLVQNGVHDVAFEDVENVRLLLNDVRLAKVNLSEGVFCRRRSGILFLQFPELTLEYPS